jgi:hypothetical protein
MFAIDDGAVIYLNGREVRRVGMPADAPIAYGTRPSRTVGTARLEGPVTLPADHLRVGENTLAVEVHQISDASHDIAFALALRTSTSITNTVITFALAGLQLSEVLARNRTLPNDSGAIADWVELRNGLAQPLDISGASLTDRPDQPGKWAFPAGTILPPGGRLVLECDPDRAISAANTGLGLGGQGGAIYVFAPVGQGSSLLDSLQWGLQVPDLSIGRTSGGNWTLCQPTPGEENAPVQLGSPADLRINEWMASSAGGQDWLELFNGGLARWHWAASHSMMICSAPGRAPFRPSPLLALDRTHFNCSQPMAIQWQGQSTSALG